MSTVGILRRKANYPDQSYTSAKVGTGLLRRIFRGRRLTGRLVIKVKCGTRETFAFVKPDDTLGSNLLFLPRTSMADLRIREGGDAKVYAVAPRQVRSLKFVRLQLEDEEDVSQDKTLTRLLELAFVQKGRSGMDAKIKIEMEAEEHIPPQKALDLLLELRLVHKNKNFKILDETVAPPAKAYRF